MEELHAALSEQSIKAGFKDLDMDGSGGVDFDEFAVLSTVMGRHTHPIFSKALDNLHQTMRSGDHPEVEGVDEMTIKKVAARSWRKMASLRPGDMNDRALGEAFQRMDANHDGYLNKDEIRAAVKSLCPRLPHKDMLMMIATADTNRDDQVSFSEWKALMTFDADKEMALSLRTFGGSDRHASPANDSTGRPVHHGTSIPRFGMNYSPFADNF